jgi:hypothetical protein
MLLTGNDIKLSLCQKTQVTLTTVCEQLAQITKQRNFVEGEDEVDLVMQHAILIYLLSQLQSKIHYMAKSLYKLDTAADKHRKRLHTLLIGPTTPRKKARDDSAYITCARSGVHSGSHILTRLQKQARGE